MPRQPLWFRVLALLAVLTAGVLLPSHLAEEHHDAAPLDHEGSGHDESDHDSVSAVRAPAATRPPLEPASKIWAIAPSSFEYDLALPVVAGSMRIDDLSLPDHPIPSPTPSRAPPQLLA